MAILLSKTATSEFSTAAHIRKEGIDYYFPCLSKQQSYGLISTGGTHCITLYSRETIFRPLWPDQESYNRSVQQILQGGNTKNFNEYWEVKANALCHSQLQPAPYQRCLTYWMVDSGSASGSGSENGTVLTGAPSPDSSDKSPSPKVLVVAVTFSVIGLCLFITAAAFLSYTLERKKCRTVCAYPSI
ncbi:MAG: hypothetical protein ACR2PT_04590 [Endozoicomonas sp.]